MEQTGTNSTVELSLPTEVKENNFLCYCDCLSSENCKLMHLSMPPTWWGREGWVAQGILTTCLVSNWGFWLLLLAWGWESLSIHHLGKVWRAWYVPTLNLKAWDGEGTPFWISVKRGHPVFYLEWLLHVILHSMIVKCYKGHARSILALKFPAFQVNS